MMQNNEVINTIRKWAAEMRDPHNDGYVQEGYRNKLKEVRDIIGDAIPLVEWESTLTPPQPKQQ